ncbi:spore coat protein YeeK domain protein [Necator americanus]|uniref:Spore coat protein YeeK domain protein n=1 Tax=Necator americanus TaxID=51031 RepID=W2T697_NECAM|nr:spore coat protein YeeK domain protein [Necator americanus]ETN77149.1 spore coat protein YeeK domain protein [Necator americanus]
MAALARLMVPPYLRSTNPLILVEVHSLIPVSYKKSTSLYLKGINHRRAPCKEIAFLSKTKVIAFMAPLKTGHEMISSKLLLIVFFIFAFVCPTYAQFGMGYPGMGYPGMGYPGMGGMGMMRPPKPPRRPKPHQLMGGMGYPGMGMGYPGMGMMYGR